MSKSRIVTVGLWVCYGLTAFIAGDLHTPWPIIAILPLGFVATMRTMDAA